MKRLFTALLTVLALTSSQSLFAANFKGLLGLGYEGGGDNILTARYTDGSTSTLAAGQGVFFSGGLGLQDLLSNPDGITLDTQVTLGVKVDTLAEARNASGTLTRFPIEGMVFGRYHWFRIGAGPSYHLGTNYYGTGVAAGRFNLNSSIGFISEMDFFFSKALSLGVRYGTIQYTLDNNSPMAGTSYGANLSWFL